VPTGYAGRTSGEKPLPIAFGLLAVAFRAVFFPPLDKLLKQNLFFLIVHRGTGGLPLALSGNASLAGGLAAGRLAASRRWGCPTRNLHELLLGARRSRLLRSAASLFALARLDSLRDGRARRRIIGTSPSEPVRTLLLCRNICGCHCDNGRQKSGHQ